VQLRNGQHIVPIFGICSHESHNFYRLHFESLSPFSLFRSDHYCGEMVNKLKSVRNEAQAALICHAWEMGEQFRKVAKKYPQSRESLLEYSDRLDAISSSLLSLLPIMGNLLSKDSLIAGHHLGRCHRLIEPLYGLQELLKACNGDKNKHPVLELSDQSLGVFTGEAKLYFSNSLSNVEEAIFMAVRSMRDLFQFEGGLILELERQSPPLISLRKKLILT
jgi:hypothetical protein